MSAPGRVPPALRWWLLAGIVLVTLQLRAPITGVPPALDRIAESLALSPTAAGTVTALPLLCFGVFAFLTPLLSARFGLEPTLWAAALLVLVGMGVRHDARLVTFFAGTLLLGLGMAIGNVVVPALVRTWFPDRLALALGLYTIMIQVSGAGGPFVTAPLLARGWHWPDALSVWLVPGVAGLLLWTLVSVQVARVRRGHPHHTAPPSGMAHVARRPLTWVITFVQGTQSLIFFTLITWLPVQLRAHGLGDAQTGLVLSIYSILGLPASFWAANLVRGRGGPARIVGLVVANTLGLALLPFGVVPAIVGTVICGVCQGLWLVVALTFIASQADAADVPAVSALAQGTGYLWAALGPVAVGAAYATTGSLVAGIVGLVALGLAMGAASLWVAGRLHPR